MSVLVGASQKRDEGKSASFSLSAWKKFGSADEMYAWVYRYGPEAYYRSQGYWPGGEGPSGYGRRPL